MLPHAERQTPAALHPLRALATLAHGGRLASTGGSFRFFSAYGAGPGAATTAMYPKAEEDAPLHGQATGFPMSGGGGGGYYQAGGATAAFAVQAQQAPVAAWSTGLCDCFDDCGNCKIFLPSILVDFLLAGDDLTLLANGNVQAA